MRGLPLSLGRRKVGLHDPDRWVFNKMAGAYASRPAYPAALIDAIASLAPPAGGSRVLDVGAGIGHLALPLAERGLEVTAVEPATEMLERLRSTAGERGLAIRNLHATAEDVPLPDASADLIVVADALHFLDAERSASEMARLLAPRGALAIVIAELGATPFMRALVDLMHEHAPRRPRRTEGTLAQVLALARVEPLEPLRFADATAVGERALEEILRSISFIGPAMSAERFAAFRAGLAAVAGPRIWSRSFTLHAARRR